MNPISGTQSRPSPEEIEEKMDNKIKEFMRSQELKQTCREIVQEILSNNETYESKIVTTEEELIELANKGYDCQEIGSNKWLMKKYIC